MSDECVVHDVDVSAPAPLQTVLPKRALRRLRAHRAQRLAPSTGDQRTCVCTLLHDDGMMFVQPLSCADHLNQLQIVLNYYMTELSQYCLTMHAKQDGTHPLSTLCPKEPLRHPSQSELALATNLPDDKRSASFAYARWCIALHAKTKCFYRARIMRRVEPHLVEVEFVDYGDGAVLHVGDVYFLPDELRLLPPCASACRLNEASRRAITGKLDDCRRAMEGLCINVKFEEYDPAAGVFNVRLLQPPTDA